MSSAPIFGGPPPTGSPPPPSDQPQSIAGVVRQLPNAIFPAAPNAPQKHWPNSWKGAMIAFGVDAPKYLDKSSRHRAGIRKVAT